MTDWVFYSASQRGPTVGDLLRSIPSRRNLRLERTLEDEGEAAVEAVRAAEMLLGLQVAMRLTNDPTGALRIDIDRVGERARAEYRGLNCGAPRAEDLRIRVEIEMLPVAIQAGHADLADDVVAGLEGVYPGGVAYCRATSEVITGRELVAAMDADARVWSHVDAHFEAQPMHSDYILHMLGNLADPLRGLVSRNDGLLKVRGRAPAKVTNEQLAYARDLLAYCTNFAHRGHLKFRSDGVWEGLVDRIMPDVAPPPEEWLKVHQRQSPSISGMFSKLFGKSR